jgi:hypothetical protein
VPKKIKKEMKQKGLFWSVFFGAQPLLAQTDSSQTLKRSEPIPCFVQCLNRKPMHNVRDTLCCSELRISIEQVQHALNRRGFSVKVNGQFDAKTKKAWIAFMKEKGLPVGSDWDMLRALGIITRIE